jgi:hypothetical protein
LRESWLQAVVCTTPCCGWDISYEGSRRTPQPPEFNLTALAHKWSQETSCLSWIEHKMDARAEWSVLVCINWAAPILYKSTWYKLHCKLVQCEHIIFNLDHLL